METRTKRLLLLALASLVAAVLLYFVSQFLQTQEKTEEAAEETVAEEQETGAETVQVKESVEFADFDALYDYDLTEVQTLYVTAVEGDASRGTNHTLAEVNSFVNIQGMANFDKIYCDCIVKAGDENGPVSGMLGYNTSFANATMCVRGRTSSEADLKSYKIELFDDVGTWNSMTSITLNKHYYDLTRIRNALYFAMLQKAPDLLSLRTYFVHLYICDNTASGDGSGEYVDYGLYTAVEQPNKSYLKNRGFSASGSLYKTNMFEYFRYEDAIKLESDPTYDEQKFMEVLEPKAGTNDHSKLIAMLEAVNDYSIPIAQIVEQYFDEDNLLGFMAFNILMENPDCAAQNFYLFSPVNSEKWYVIDWDGDACLNNIEDEIRGNLYTDSEWMKGISNFSACVLYRRMICDIEFRNKLTEKIEEYRQFITKDAINELIDELYPAVEPFLYTAPDNTLLRAPYATIEQVLDEMANDTDIAYANYYESLEKPLPFYLADVTAEDGKLLFQWDDAYDFDGELVTYELQVSSDISFTEGTILYDKTMLSLSDSISMLAPGTYYFRVIATNESGYTRLAYDEVTKNGCYYGLREFMVTENGSVVMNDG